MFTVTAVSTDKRSITVLPSTGCAGGGGNIVGVNRDRSISDLLITNNTYLNGPQDFYVMGHGKLPRRRYRGYCVDHHDACGVEQTRPSEWIAHVWELGTTAARYPVIRSSFDWIAFDTADCNEDLHLSPITR